MTTTTSTVRLGDTLPNGATVLAYRSNGDGTGIVLAYTDPASYQPFVTWSLREQDLVTVSGDYFVDLADAVNDFRER